MLLIALAVVFQWITLVRRHAEVVIADNVIFPAFKRYCKVRQCLINKDTIKQDSSSMCDIEIFGFNQMYFRNLTIN